MNLRKTVEEVDQIYHTRKVVLVDVDDNELGIGGLVEAHREKGLKHRAFSLQLYRKVDDKFELLLQQRAESKPVFPLFWANTCCYNMAPGEKYLERAVSRVKEEVGVEVGVETLRELYKFSYEANDIEGWCENELDNVIVGEWSGEFEINPNEAMDARWVEWGELNKDIKEYPDKYAPWFKMIVSDSRFRSVFE
jgi:isopentenyl-diphosphate delta-isomerase